MSFCSFKQIQSWVEGPCWWYMRWCGLALTPVDIMVHWKMSCQLMEELPVAAGRSVATGAMCVNLFPCHFFCLSLHPLSFHLHLFLFPFTPPPTLQIPLPLPTLYCDKLLLAVDLLVVKSVPCAGMKVGWAGEEGTSPPPPPTPCMSSPPVPHLPAQPHTCTQRWDVSMEIDILSHKISLD